MARKSEADSAITLIISVVGLLFIIIGYAIMFFEKINQYNLWLKFWKTVLPLIVCNIIGCLIYNAYIDFSLFLFIISWLAFIIYWSCVIYNEDVKVRQEIVNQIGVETANCPYCGKRLKKFPARKTQCPHCNNFIYVRTRPADNKTFLLKQEHINEFEHIYIKKKRVKTIPVIDATDEMGAIIDFLCTNYKTFCNYPQIQTIKENDRLDLMKYIWEHWAVRINYKNFQEEFSEYNSELLEEIIKIETLRRDTFFKVQEFKERGWEKEPLIKISNVPPNSFSEGVSICTINTMIDVCNWYIKNFNLWNIPPTFLEMPSEYFLADKPLCPIFLFIDNEFKQVTLKELKTFCKNNKYGYPYRN